MEPLLIEKKKSLRNERLLCILECILPKELVTVRNDSDAGAHGGCQRDALQVLSLDGRRFRFCDCFKQRIEIVT